MPDSVHIVDPYFIIQVKAQQTSQDYNLHDAIYKLLESQTDCQATIVMKLKGRGGTPLGAIKDALHGVDRRMQVNMDLLEEKAYKIDHGS